MKKSNFLSCYPKFVFVHCFLHEIDNYLYSFCRKKLGKNRNMYTRSADTFSVKDTEFHATK